MYSLMKSRYIFVLSFSLILNICLIYFLKDRILNKLKPHPSLYSYQRNDLFEHFSVDSNSLVFLGDSFTHQFELFEIFKNENVKNRGIDGDRIRGLQNRLSSIIKSQPKKVFILIGANDLASKRSVEDIITDYNRLVETLKSSCPKTIIYIQSIFPVANESPRFRMCNPETNLKILKINSKLRQIATEQRVEYIDNYSKFQKDGRIDPAYVLQDGLHLSAEGYLLWSKLLDPYVNSTKGSKYISTRNIADNPSEHEHSHPDES